MPNKTYKCELCNYSTSDRGNYSKHKKTKKHLKKVNIENNKKIGNKITHSKTTVNLPRRYSKKIEKKVHSCEYCDETFARKDSMRRHQRTCAKKMIENMKEAFETKEQLLQMQHEIKTLKDKIKHKDEIIKKEIERGDIYQEHADRYRKLYDDTSSIANNVVSAFRLLSEAFVNPPAIKEGRLEDILTLYDESKDDPIEVVEIEEIESDDDGDYDSDYDSDYSIDDPSDPISEDEIDMDDHQPIKKKDDDFIENIFQHHGDGTLHIYIANMIVKIYKKDNAEDQTIFNSDTSRLTYIISRILYNEGETRWHIDKGGVSTKNIILKPILDELKSYKGMEKKNMVAVDPNMSDLLYCVDSNKKDRNFFRYTQNQRRKEMKDKKYKNIILKEKKKKIRNKTIIQYETELSLFNKKTLDIKKFKKYVKKKNEINHKLFKFYQKRLFRKLKLNGYWNRQKSEQRMINRFKNIFGKPKDTIVCIGDWEQRKHRKFKEPIKGKGFRTLFRRNGYKVYLVDEFRTSCKCSKCEGNCEKFRKCRNPKPMKNDEIISHGLLMCKTCKGLWNRDENSSGNIYKIAHNAVRKKKRPKYLRRSSCQ